MKLNINTLVESSQLENLKIRKKKKKKKNSS